jgi:hypothetical protein
LKQLAFGSAVLLCEVLVCLCLWAQKVDMSFEADVAANGTIGA